jgi:hypothetical protein
MMNHNHFPLKLYNEMAHPNTPAVDLTGHGTLGQNLQPHRIRCEKKPRKPRVAVLEATGSTGGSGMCGHDELKMSVKQCQKPQK